MASSTYTTNILHLIGENGDLESQNNISTFIQDEISAGAGSTHSPSADGSDNSFEVVNAPPTSLSQVGLKYRVVGVFGGQSSGKSTLLNRLFGTKFETMDAEKGRQQTTKGAFFSKAPIGENLFVVDFEGTDGAERGDDQSFERQLSLFALSCADTLIMNMWVTEVGRFNAGNMALLRTVFEVNLQLFAHVGEEEKANKVVVEQRDKEKPTLLFVLRDWAGVENGGQPKETLFSSLTRTLNTVWVDVRKPDCFKDAVLTDFFDMKFEALPNYQFQKPQFDAACEDLKNKFVDNTKEGYLFRSNETFRGVPLEALPQYLNSCWESIQSSRDLNIPSQRQLVAKMRCREAVAGAVNAYKEFAAGLEARIKKERVLKLSNVLKDQLEATLVDFGKATQLYSGAISSKQERSLKRQLNKISKKVLTYQCCFIANEELEQNESAVLQVIDTSMKRLTKAAEGLYNDELEQSKENPGGATVSAGNWSVKNDAVVSEFWNTVRGGVTDLVGNLQKRIEGKGECKNSTVLNSDPESLSMVLMLLKDAANKKIQARLEAMAADAEGTLTKHFTKALDEDQSTGAPRTFRSQEALLKAYKPAAHSGLLLLSCLFAARLEAPVAADEGLFLNLGSPSNLVKPRYPKDALERVQSMIEAQEAALGATMSSAAPSQRKAKAADALLAVAEKRNISDAFADEAEEVESEGEEDEDESVASPAKSNAATSNENTPSVIINLGEDAVNRAFDLYAKECEFTFRLRQTQVAQNSKALPGWVYVAFLVFGGNEMYAILTSPVLLICFVLISYFFLRSFFEEQFGVLEEKSPATAAAIKMGWSHVVPYVEQAKKATGLDKMLDGGNTSNGGNDSTTAATPNTTATNSSSASNGSGASPARKTMKAKKED